MSHPDDLLPWPGSGGAGTLTCPLESPLQRCFLLSASVESLSKDRINSVTVQTKFYLFPGLKLYFVEGRLYDPAEALAFGKDYQAQLPFIFEHTGERTSYLLYSA